MNNIEKFKQQGDVLLFKTNIKIPDNAEKVNPDSRGIVLAEGEVTGHYHGIENLSDAQLYKIGEKMLLQVFKPTTIKHQEHKEVTLDAGIWEVGIVKEYDHFAEEAKRVVD